MDRRSLLLLIGTCLVLVFWYPLMERVYPPKPVVPGATNGVAQGAGAAAGGTGAVAVAGAPANAVTAAGTPNVVAPAAPVTVAAVPVRPGSVETGFAVPAGTAEEMALENDHARYVFTSAGGGVKQVELKGHRDAMTWTDRRAGKPVGPAVINRSLETPIMAVLGLEGAGAAGQYRLARSNDAVVASRELGNSVRLVKEFRIGSNHVMHVTARLQNWSAAAQKVPAQEWVFGTAAPLNAAENAMYLGFFEYDGNSSQHFDESWFANRTLGCFPGTPRATYLSDRTNTVWGAVHNQFFATLVMPGDRTGRLFARHVDLPAAVGSSGGTPLSGYQAAVVYPAEELAPQQERVREFDLYVGPKEYGAIAVLGNNADVVMGFDNYFGGRFSGFFARLLLLAMNGLHNKLGLSYALAIIAITVSVRLLFWPLMQASARTSKRMAALQPQIKELQEKYKENPQKMNQKMLELWREHKVNPASGCLPILIQFPILLGFYSMLQTAIELRGESFLWAFDLSQTDTIAMIPGLNFPINPLPLFMGFTMLWQARLQPVSPSMDPAQQKLMKYMPLMFMFMLYNFSAGLTLYWSVSNLLSILQMKLTKAKDAAKDGPAAGAVATAGGAGGRRPRPGTARK
jgi:YidC/Oxa1 family membrane protein insertase